MAWKRLFKPLQSRGEETNSVCNRAGRLHEPERVSGPPVVANNSNAGIALFMVIAAISVLSLLVTEFTYIAQMNQKLAFDGLDSLKAFYLAKSGYKLSLLRLKAYQQIKAYVQGLGGADKSATGGGGSPVSKAMLDKIWSFPFMYPVPAVPGMSAQDKEAIEKFQKESNLQGNFSAIIESESSKYNLNMILAPYAPQPSPSPSPSVSPGTNPSPSPTPTFNPEEARKSLTDYLGQLIQNKANADPDFAAEYRDTKVQDLMDNIVAWADNTFEKQLSSIREAPPKKAPFYALSELHMIPLMDDGLYDLFAPSLTVSITPGINVNTMQENTLRALVPNITDEEAKEFFKFRDSEEEDNLFKTDEDFYKWIGEHVAGLKGGVDGFKQELQKRNIRIVTDETEFKITVRATVNQSVKTLEAWVSLTSPKKNDAKSGNPSTSNSQQPQQPNPTPNGTGTETGTPENKPDPGLKVLFMRTS